MARAPLIVLSGPSGGGKSTVVDRLLGRGELPLHRSISVTTREPRPGETDGIDYHFWDRERFQEHLDKDDFLEWAEVHLNRYGTLRSEVENYRNRGVGVILVIDVQGAGQIREQYPDCVSVFLRAPSDEAYRQRLVRRGTEDVEAMERRLRRAREEEKYADDYDHVVVNDDLDRAVGEVRQIVKNLF